MFMKYGFRNENHFLKLHLGYIWIPDTQVILQYILVTPVLLLAKQKIPSEAYLWHLQLFIILTVLVNIFW